MWKETWTGTHSSVMFMAMKPITTKMRNWGSSSIKYCSTKMLRLQAWRAAGLEGHRTLQAQSRESQILWLLSQLQYLLFNATLLTSPTDECIQVKDDSVFLRPASREQKWAVQCSVGVGCDVASVVLHCPQYGQHNEIEFLWELGAIYLIYSS